MSLLQGCGVSADQVPEVGQLVVNGFSVYKIHSDGQLISLVLQSCEAE